MSLAGALSRAAAAGQWDIVTQLAKELEARRPGRGASASDMVGKGES